MTSIPLMKLVANYIMFHLQVAQSFLTALQNDERANYQLDAKFQESYLTKAVSLLQCELLEGAATNKDAKETDLNNGSTHNETNCDEVEEGELPDSHGKLKLIFLSLLASNLCNIYICAIRSSKILQTII